MNFTQKEKLTRAQQAMSEGDYAEAEAILKPLWDAFPFEHEVFHLLKECYVALGNWPAAEALVMQFGATLSGEDYKNEALLELYLAQKDIQKALETASRIIVLYPDFYDSIADMGYRFKSAGFEQNYLNFLNELILPGFNRHIALAVSSAHFNGDYETAIDHVKNGLEEQPEDELLLSYLENFNDNLKLRMVQEARALISHEKSGDAVAACKAVWQMNPESVTAQEYYLSALACKKFPPFYWYFYQWNFAGPASYSFRGILYVIFFVICALYYRGGKSTDHLESVVWLFAGMSIPRYTLFPLMVQLLAFFYVPGYHLLKKPFDFIKGTILLGVWLLALHNAMNPHAPGFHYFLTGCFATHVFLFDHADNLTSSVQKKLLRCYAGLALTLAVLSYFQLIPDIFLLLVFAAWLPPMFIGIGWNFFQKYRTIHRQSNAELDPESSGFRYNGLPEDLKATVRLQLIFGILAAAGFLGFALTQYVPGQFESLLMFSSFAVFFYSLTVSLSCSRDPENVRDMGWLWKNSATFQWTVGLLGLGMLIGVVSLVPFAKTPLRNDWRWIPGVVAFFMLLSLLYFNRKLSSVER